MIGNLTRCIGACFPYRKLGHPLDNALGLPYRNHDGTNRRKGIPNIMIQLIIAHEKRISERSPLIHLNPLPSAEKYLPP